MKRKIVSLLVTACFVIQQAGFCQIASGPQASLSGSAFRPLHLRSISLQPAGQGVDLVLDKGDAADLQPQTVRSSTDKLMGYFLIGISLPNDSFWVNLRPDSPREMIDPRLEKTDLGKVLLEADLQLKKDMAALTSPDTASGREYWDQLYAKAGQLFGSDSVEIPALTRPWIVPGEVIIAQTSSGAYVYKATLNVMLEQDYLKDQAQFSFNDPRVKALNEYSSQLVRSLLLPQLIRAVNTSKRYAQLRQVYYSLILAQWFKQRYARQAAAKHPFISRINSANLDGLVSQSPWSKMDYFKAYEKSFSQGEYRKEEQMRTSTGLMVRTYFSGGAVIDAAKALQAPGAVVNAVSGRIPEGAGYLRISYDGAARDGGNDASLKKLPLLQKYLEDSFNNGELTDQSQIDGTMSRVKEWLTNPAYQNAFPRLVDKLVELIDRGQWKTITECFYQELIFGTAGKRGRQVETKTGDVLPGVNVINDFTVAEYTLGLAEYLDKTKQADRGVVIGGDTRIRSVLPYNDEDPYTVLQAKILRSKGIKVYRFRQPRSIAEVSWYTTFIGAAGMIYNSASHNFAWDNGIKASNEFGAQLFPDEKIAILEKIKAVKVEDIAALELDSFDLNADRAHNPDRHFVLGNELDEQTGKSDRKVDQTYIDVNKKYIINPRLVSQFALQVVPFYTPGQGAGGDTIPVLLRQLGYEFLQVSKRQSEQDSQGRFNTVLKPDPAYEAMIKPGDPDYETMLKPGDPAYEAALKSSSEDEKADEAKLIRSLDVAISEAQSYETKEKIKVDFVAGTDPDADRSAIAVRNNDNEWVVLKANDVWSLICWYMLSQKEVLPKYLIKTWVTTDLIKVIAEDIAKDTPGGITVFQPAVGFDKIAQVALKEIALPEFYKKHRLGPYTATEKSAKLSLDDLVKALQEKGLNDATRQSVTKELSDILYEQLAFGAEESNGFSPGGHTLEKDGAVALVIFHEVAAFVKFVNENKNSPEKITTDKQMQGILREYFKSNGKMTIYNLLNALYLRYGYYATVNIPLEFSGLKGTAQKDAVLKAIKASAGALGSTNLKFGDQEVDSAISGAEASQCNDVKFEEKDAWKFRLKRAPDDDYIITRASGTENYIRFYGQHKVSADSLTWKNIEEEKDKAGRYLTGIALSSQQAFKEKAGLTARDGGIAMKSLFAAAGIQDKEAIADDNIFREIGFEGDNARLGWVSPPSWEEVKAVLQQFLGLSVVQGKENFVFSGMGGSINTVKAVNTMMKSLAAQGMIKSDYTIYTIDSLDPAAMKNMLEEIGEEGLKETLVIGISKSVTTKETQDLLKTLREKFTANKLAINDHFLWMIDEENKANMATTGWDAQTATMPIQVDGKTDIGGRFTAPHTLIYLIPALLMLNKDMSVFERGWKSYLGDVQRLQDQVPVKVDQAVAEKAQKFAIVVKDQVTVDAIETWIVQLFQESLGSKKTGFDPKTVVITEDQLADHPDFYPVRFEVPGKDSVIDTMLTMYFSQLFVALLASEEKINFVDQDAVQKYKKAMNEASGQEIPAAERANIEEIAARIADKAVGKKFVEAVCYWDLSFEQRAEIKASLAKAFPQQAVLVFQGSDWNHHSYQAAESNTDTLFLILTKPAAEYAQQINGVPQQMLHENIDSLRTIAYATYSTLEDKAGYFEVSGGVQNRDGGILENKVVTGAPARTGGVDLRAVPMNVASSAVFPENVKGFLAECCRNKQAGKPAREGLDYLAQLLRSQEDMVCPAEPEVKAALAYLSS